jgi:hypothetical protein
MSWLGVTEWPELHFQCYGNRNRPINLVLFIVMLVKLTVPQLVKQLPASHGTGRLTATPPTVPSLCQMDSAQVFLSCFYKISFNIILPSVSVSSK